MWLIAGLGNPGAKYESTRHNVGFAVVDLLAQRFGPATWQSKGKARLAQVRMGNEVVVLLKPMTFMNLSGEAVQATASFYKLDLDHVVVVHDDIDLKLGQLKLKQGGGHGGQNGVRDIARRMGAEFSRVRCGVGRPRGTSDAASHVLTPFAKDEAADAQIMIDDAAGAVELVVRENLLAAQNRYHGTTGQAVTS
jgi:PTH1 family peptidyl-tRNA hydrolase